MTAILAAVRWHAIVALICLCLVANDSELFSIYLVSMFFASFKKIPTYIILSIFNRLFFIDTFFSPLYIRGINAL